MSSVFMETLTIMISLVALSLAQTCHNPVHINKRVRGPNKGYLRHDEAGLTRDCLESLPDLQVTKNDVKCFKWRVKKSGEVVLRERPVEKQKLVTSAGSVLFRSPGIDSKKQHYSNNMFCLYNITIPNCDSITVQSLPGEHSLYWAPDSTVQDYLFLDYGGAESPTTLHNKEVASYLNSVHTSSFYAILWSDPVLSSSAGGFELVAVCNTDNAVEDSEGSRGSTLRST